MDIGRLREATKHDHAAVEGSIALLSATLTLEEYAATLDRMYLFIQAWEKLAEAVAPPELLSFVQVRARAGLLERDLHHLRVDPATLATVTLPQIGSTSEFLGALYVMEGSRLGGQLIARHVSNLLQLDGLGTEYFRGFGEKTGLMWKALVEVLESQVPESETELTIQAAKDMFQTFGKWMSNGIMSVVPCSVLHSGESRNG